MVTVGNAAQKVTATQVWYPAGASAAAQQVATVAKTATTSASGAVSRVTLVLGTDFVLPGGFASSGSIPDASVWKGVARKVAFPVQAPAYIPSGYTISKRSPDNATIYKIKVGDGSQPALIMLYKLKGKDQYLNITETTWLDAPLASQGRQVTHDGTVFTVVGTADKVERVWWKSDGVLYWVSNTLSHLATEQELLAVAESMISVSAQ